MKNSDGFRKKHNPADFDSPIMDDYGNVIGYEESFQVHGLLNAAEEISLSDINSQIYTLKSAAQAILESSQMRAEARHWKLKYDELLNSSVKHADMMSGRILQLALHGNLRSGDPKIINPEIPS